MEPKHSRGERRTAKKNGALSSDAEDTEPAAIERLLGIAMGCMGMSMMDFCRCVPSEFYAAYEAWHEMQQQREQAQWERMRMQCLCSLQPYSKEKLKPQDVMQFPWESEEGRVKSEESSSSASGREELSHEELMARYRKAKAEVGL